MSNESSSAAHVAFLHDTTRLISIGTDDCTIMQWTVLTEAESMVAVDTRRMSAVSTADQVEGKKGMNNDEIDDNIESVRVLAAAEHASAYLDSDSEDSDSDLSGDEIDSDIEREKQISYDRTLYREDYQVRYLLALTFVVDRRSNE